MEGGGPAIAVGKGGVSEPSMRPQKDSPMNWLSEGVERLAKVDSCLLEKANIGKACRTGVGPLPAVHREHQHWALSGPATCKTGQNWTFGDQRIKVKLATR